MYDTKKREAGELGQCYVVGLLMNGDGKSYKPLVGAGPRLGKEDAKVVGRSKVLP